MTGTPSGIAAGHAAGMHVIAVGAGDKAALLEGFGAERVVPELRALLDPRLLQAVCGTGAGAPRRTIALARACI